MPESCVYVPSDLSSRLVGLLQRTENSQELSQLGLEDTVGDELSPLGNLGGHFRMLYDFSLEVEGLTVGVLPVVKKKHGQFEG